MKALIDGDAVAYMAGFKCQRKVWVAEYQGVNYNLDTTKKVEIIKHIKTLYPTLDKKDINWSYELIVEPENHAYHSVNLIIKQALLDTNSEEYLVVIGNPVRENNFRHQVATILPYKGNRKADDAPALLPSIRNFLIDRWNARVVDGHETDDELMIEHHKNFYKTVICTIDKDFKNAAKFLYNLRTKEYLHLTRADNEYHFWYQVIYGDQCDNIPGLRKWMTPKKFGPKGVDKALAPVKGCKDSVEYENHVWELYKANHHETVAYKHPSQIRDKYLERLDEIKQLLWIKTK